MVGFAALTPPYVLAAIAQGVAKRAEQGNASSVQAVQAGRMVEMLATLGLDALG